MEIVEAQHFDKTGVILDSASNTMKVPKQSHPVWCDGITIMYSTATHEPMSMRKLKHWQTIFQTE